MAEARRPMVDHRGYRIPVSTYPSKKTLPLPFAAICTISVIDRWLAEFLTTSLAPDAPAWAASWMISGCRRRAQSISMPPPFDTIWASWVNGRFSMDAVLSDIIGASYPTFVKRFTTAAAPSGRMGSGSAFGGGLDRLVFLRGGAPETGDQLGRDRVAEDVDRGAAHIHEGVYPRDQRDRLDRQSDRRQHGRQDHQRARRDVGATLAGDHHGQQDRQQFGPAQGYVVGLGHE